MADAEDIPGYDDLQQALTDFPLTIRKKLLMAAMREGGQVLIDAMASRAPVLDPALSTPERFSGALKAGIMQRLFDSSPYEVSSRVGPEKSTYWGLFTEKGTKFEQPEAFMQPAFDETEETIMDAIAAALSDGIVKELAK